MLVPPTDSTYIIDRNGTRENLNICDDEDLESAKEVHPETSYTTVTEFILQLNNAIISNRTLVKLNLVSCHLGDEGLEEIYNKFLVNPLIRDNVRMIDFTHNSFLPTENSIEIIQAILSFPKLLFFNLTSTGFVVKHIKKLAQTMIHEEMSSLEKESSLEKIGKVIFINKEYIKTCIEKTRLCPKLVEGGYLPQDWADRHQEFYKVFNKMTPIKLVSFNSRYIGLRSW